MIAQTGLEVIMDFHGGAMCVSSLETPVNTIIMISVCSEKKNREIEIGSNSNSHTSLRFFRAE